MQCNRIRAPISRGIDIRYKSEIVYPIRFVYRKHRSLPGYTSLPTWSYSFSWSYITCLEHVLYASTECAAEFLLRDLIRLRTTRPAFFPTSSECSLKDRIVSNMTKEYVISILMSLAWSSDSYCI